MQNTFVLYLIDFFDHFFGCCSICVPRRIWQRLGTSPHRATRGMPLCCGRDAPSRFSLAPPPPPPLAWNPRCPPQRCCYDADMAPKQAPTVRVRLTNKERLADYAVRVSFGNIGDPQLEFGADA